MPRKGILDGFQNWAEGVFGSRPQPSRPVMGPSPPVHVDTTKLIRDIHALWADDGIMRCPPVPTTFTANGGNQANGTASISQEPRAGMSPNEVAIKPWPIRLPPNEYVTKAQREVMKRTRIYTDPDRWTAPGAPYAPAQPEGLPSEGPYTPSDVVGGPGPHGGLARDDPGNVVEIYGYPTEAIARRATRQGMSQWNIPRNNVGIRCPPPFPKR